MKFLQVFILFFLLPFVGNAQNNGDNLTEKKIYYDYCVIVDLYDAWHINNYRFIINPDTARNEFIYITYLGTSPKSIGEPIDSTIITLTNNQLDTIFILTKNIFIINKKAVKYDPSQLRIIGAYDGTNATVTLNTGLGNDTYVAEIPYADVEYNSNNDFIVLFTYLKKMINGLFITPN